MMDPEAATALTAAAKAADCLIEHCDAVLVLGSGTTEDRDTFYVREQRGNLHAIEGAVREWLRKLDNYEAGYHAEQGRHDAETHRRSREQPPETGEDWKTG